MESRVILRLKSCLLKQCGTVKIYTQTNLRIDLNGTE